MGREKGLGDSCINERREGSLVPVTHPIISPADLDCKLFRADAVSNSVYTSHDRAPIQIALLMFHIGIMLKKTTTVVFESNKFPSAAFTVYSKQICICLFIKEIRT